MIPSLITPSTFSQISFLSPLNLWPNTYSLERISLSLSLLLSRSLALSLSSSLSAAWNCRAEPRILKRIYLSSYPSLSLSLENVWDSRFRRYRDRQIEAWFEDTVQSRVLLRRIWRPWYEIGRRELGRWGKPRSGGRNGAVSGRAASVSADAETRGGVCSDFQEEEEFLAAQAWIHG